MKRYNPTEIEPKWQQQWATDKRYQAANDTSDQKFYVSGMFPYPSAAGMHIGHAFEHAIVDAVARFQRAHGRNVMNTMGWDAFGLPAENYAIKTGTAPAVVTKENIANFKNQLTRMGVSIDWSREVNTSDPEYYRWTQWVFAQFFKRGLAYQKEANQWWCPVDMTVLANEQVEAGKCWRCGSQVEKKAMKQWFFKITDYADALLEETPDLDWPEKIKTAQTNWIGRSQGAEIDFVVDRLPGQSLQVFTTRPDTIFGATFLVLAPEHPLVASLVNDDTRDTVDDYVANAIKKSEIERAAEGKEKTGVFTGSYAINPANGEKIPIWIADYVLGGYGTGAIMAVPAHDERDLAFAEKYKLPIVQVVADYDEIRDGSYRSVVDGADSREREVIDAIITDGRGKYLVLSRENEDYFVGGGVEPEDESTEAAIRREILEETGYSAIISISQATPQVAARAYRPKKGLNEKTWGAFYEVVIDPSVKVESEADLGRHTMEWVDRDDVTKTVNVKHHLEAWNSYIQHGLVATDASVREGVLVNSGHFDGIASSEAREQVVAWLEQQGIGRAKTTYKMRDWLISRQRYWGAPIPIVHCPDHGAVLVPDDQLPVLLPEVEDYAPRGDGKSVLARDETWVNTTCPTCNGPAKRETDTMDGYACSSWYLLRYTDPNNTEQAWDPERAKYWSPIDMYVGGDHAVAHLLYVRFWNHVFYDMGLVPGKEPVKKLVYHGLIGAEDGRKMSKSLGNVVDPLEVIDQGYGADALRTFELFLGPINENSQWSSRGIAGVYRFLNRAWTLTHEYIDYASSQDDQAAETDRDLLAIRHKTVKKVTSDIHRLSFNTAIAALMEYVNDLYKLKTAGYSSDWREPIESLVQMLAIFAPHMSAELWQNLGNGDMLDRADWPAWDDALTQADTMTIVVQVNGKVRGTLELAKDTDPEDIKAQALLTEGVKRHLGGKKPAKVIYIPGRLVSIVA